MNNSKLTTSNVPTLSEKGTNVVNLLVMPEFKNREKSLLKLKTPVELTEPSYSSSIKPISLHVIDDQKCLADVESLISTNSLEAIDRSDSKPNRAAVSPEQSKKDEFDVSVNSAVQNSKSISKFFKDVREE